MPKVDLNCRLKFEMFEYPEASAISAIECSFLFCNNLQAAQCAIHSKTAHKFY